MGIFFFSRVVQAMKHSTLMWTTQRHKKKQQGGANRLGWKMNGTKENFKKDCAYRKKNDERKREGERRISNSGNER